MIRRVELVEHLETYLSVKDIEDYPNALNGVQVEGGEEVARVMTAVDASVAASIAAAEWGADMLIVHHGIYWEGLKPLTGRFRRRVAPLIKNDISLYSSHLPLDAHPEVGNNSVLARMLDLPECARFGDFHGTCIGVCSDAEVELGELAARLENALGAAPRILGFGPDKTRRVGVVSGGGSGALKEAYACGVDTLITGEMPHSAYFEAEEHSINVIFAGHYATETVGVRALGEHLTERFGLEHRFFDHPTGL